MEAEENVDNRKGDCRTAEPMVSLQGGHGDLLAAERTAEMRAMAQREHVPLAFVGNRVAVSRPAGHLT